MAGYSTNQETERSRDFGQKRAATPRWSKRNSFEDPRRGTRHRRLTPKRGQVIEQPRVSATRRAKLYLSRRSYRLDCAGDCQAITDLTGTCLRRHF